MCFFDYEQPIFKIGEPCKYIYFVASGIVGIEIVNQWNQKLQLDLLGRGSIIGFNSIL